MMADSSLNEASKPRSRSAKSIQATILAAGLVLAVVCLGSVQTMAAAPGMEAARLSAAGQEEETDSSPKVNRQAESSEEGAAVAAQPTTPTANGAPEAFEVTIVTVDGETVVQKTIGGTVSEVLKMANVLLKEGEATDLPSDQRVSAGNVIRIYDTFSVEIHCDGKETKYEAWGGTVAENLARAGISIGEWDEVSPALDQTVEGGNIIAVTRAFPVEIHCDGEVITKMVTKGTVADLLAQAEVTLSLLDLTDLPLEQPVASGTQIHVTRRTEATWEEDEAIPFEVQYIPSAKVTPGEEITKVEGQPGVQKYVYLHRLLEDGSLSEPELIDEYVAQEPVDAQVLIGFASKPVSPMDFECSFDANGEPLEYSGVLRGKKATGYSAKSGAKTASGMPAIVGHVAVNPKVIPYGSKLFIRSTDGKFIYGYAIAADTGIALLDGRVDVDLFYDNYADSARNGVKSVDIFVL